VKVIDVEQLQKLFS